MLAAPASHPTSEKYRVICYDISYMKYQYSVILLGSIVILLPLLHVPAGWDVILHIIFGILIIATGIIIHQYRTRGGSSSTSTRILSPLSRVRKLFVKE
jgi:uncharacterized integral membrane protein